MMLRSQDAGIRKASLTYTGIPRGRTLVVLVAQTKALAMAVRRQRRLPRRSKLADWQR